MTPNLVRHASFIIPFGNGYSSTYRKAAWSGIDCCHASFIIPFGKDIRRLIGKRKFAAGKGLSRAAKKQKADIPAIVSPIDIPSIELGPIDVPSIKIPCSVEEAVIALAAVAPTQDALISTSIEDTSARTMPTVEELNADVVVVKPSAIPIKSAISRAPSMPKIGSEWQRSVASSIPPTLE
ncbi:hypothetical protein COCNU_scaffold000901G000010 [Cocos nucifera]|nr:hypothetical protein [Cocos nucifera]